jgi:large subunit ribosomal protein L23
MKINNVIIKPILTEKSIKDMESSNRYHFKVHTKASKGAVTNAISDLFNVDVIDIKTAIMPGKPKRILKTSRFTKTSKWKKAVIQIKEGQKIKLATESK